MAFSALTYGKIEKVRQRVKMFPRFPSVSVKMEDGNTRKTLITINRILTVAFVAVNNINNKRRAV